MKKLIQKLIDNDVLTDDLKFSKRGKHILLRNQPLLTEIVQATSFIKNENINESLRERIHAIKLNISKQPTCIVCGADVRFRSDGINVGYPETCGRKCGNKNPNRIIKRKKTSIERYGTEIPQQSSSVKEKAKKTNLIRYGAEHANQAHVQHNELEKLLNVDWIASEHYENKRTLSSIAKQLNVNVTTVQRHLHKNNYSTKYFYQSTGEKELADFLKSHEIHIEQNVRNIIPPYEIDIFIPEHNIAVEFCGLYWHSEQQGKDKYYHYNKWKICNDLDIQLLTIYSDEWNKRKNVVKSSILHKLNQCNNSIYARNTQITDVSLSQKKTFFENNHIQGNGPGSISIGLKDVNKNIVAVMSFIKKEDQVYNLNRYASSTVVVGGFSKLLKYFTTNFQWKQIISFADLRWSNGNLYEKNGFTLDTTIPPDYYYSPNGYDRYHKFNYRRKNLPKLLKDFNPKLSERVNCDNNRILRVWDCGKRRYILNNASHYSS